MAVGERYLFGGSRNGGDAVGRYAAGLRRYGAGGRSAPNVGPVGDKSGYIKRERLAGLRQRITLDRAKRNAGRKISRI